MGDGGIGIEKLRQGSIIFGLSWKTATLDEEETEQKAEENWKASH